MTTRREVIALERPAPDLDQAFGGFGPGGARETKGRERRGGETAHEGLRCVGWRGRRSVAVGVVMDDAAAAGAADDAALDDVHRPRAVGVDRDRAEGDAADEAGREGAAAGLGRSRSGDERAGECRCGKSGRDGLAEGHVGPLWVGSDGASVLTPLLWPRPKAVDVRRGTRPESRRREPRNERSAREGRSASKHDEASAQAVAGPWRRFAMKASNSSRSFARFSSSTK